MAAEISPIPLWKLLIAFAPTLGLLWVMHRWSLDARGALWANARMLVQLLAVGYVLTYVFETDHPWLIAGVVAVMVGVSAWIALRPLRHATAGAYGRALAGVGISGLVMLALVTQGVLDLPRWFEPRFVVPLAGMIFANTMNTVSLAGERFEAECGRGEAPERARSVALEASMIPQVNALLAVGLVSLPGMMTGQILSGVEPLVAVRYQIMVMCMVFGSGGLGATTYLALAHRARLREGS
ncbi:MAG: ABC transporter permease [Myxococcales bacterium]|nr:ABC transporter permease [Myxococcales bacterium]